MSGGHFDYRQYTLGQIADDIDIAIECNDREGTDKWGNPISLGLSDETIARFRETSAALRRAQAMVQRVDWLLSDDDEEESFHQRWEEELDKQDGCDNGR